MNGFGIPRYRLLHPPPPLPQKDLTTAIDKVKAPLSPFSINARASKYVKRTSHPRKEFLGPSSLVQSSERGQAHRRGQAGKISKSQMTLLKRPCAMYLLTDLGRYQQYYEAFKYISIKKYQIIMFKIIRIINLPLYIQ